MTTAPIDSNTVLNRHILMYVLVTAVVAGLAAFDGALATGSVPIPHAWAWATPVLSVIAVSLTMTLPKVVDGLPPATSAAAVASVERYRQPAAPSVVAVPQAT